MQSLRLITKETFRMNAANTLKIPTWINRCSGMLFRAAGVMMTGFLLLSVFVMYGTIPNRWYQVLAVTGGSMQPELIPGDLIVITPMQETVRPGMILTLSVDNELVTHRLTGFTDTGEFITQGDANRTPDQWSPEANVRVMGLYRLRIPLLGYLAALPGKILDLSKTGSWFTDQEEVRFHLTSNDWGDPNPPHGQSGTSISADVTASGYKDPNGLAWVTGLVCVTNGGDVPTRGLQVVGQVQYKQKGKGGFLPLGDGFIIEPEVQLQPGETVCYDYRSEFSAVQTNQYRLAASVTITNHSGWMPGGNHCPGPDVCRFGPEVKTSFGLVEAAPDEPLLISTEVPVNEETPVPTEEITVPAPPTEEPLPTDGTGTEPPAETEVTPEPTESATEPAAVPTEPPVEITDLPE